MIGARFHHERFDGRGYPDKLTGKDIPRAARIIAVADAYDAMTSDRSYRRGMMSQKVYEEIAGKRGSQFDPEIADIMLSYLGNDLALDE
jgi:putative two-component system response regulator